MKLDLAKFKKISSSNSHSTFSHPDGHFIKVAHKNLAKEDMGNLKKLVKRYSEGGEVDQPEEKHPYDPGMGTVGEKVAGATEGMMPQIPHPENQPVEMASEAPSLTPSLLQQQQPAQEQSDPFGNQAYTDAYMKGYGEQKEGMAQRLEGEEKLGSETADVAKKAISDSQNQMHSYQQHYNQLDQERRAFQQDIQNQHIDPERYVNNMSTGKHVLTGIGMILSGIGSGITGQPNMAAEFLQKNIDRDISAQQMELGKSNNLLSANLRQFGNMNDAVSMTRAMSADIVSSKLKLAAANATSPMARANALKAAGDLDMAAAPIISQMAARRSLMSQQQGGKSKIAPEQIAEIVVPEKERAKVKEDIGKVQSLEEMRKAMHETNDKLQDMFMRGAISPNARDALVNNFMGKLGQMTSHRFNMEEAKNQINASLYGKTDVSADTRKLKDQNIDSLFNMLRSEFDPTINAYKQYGINVPMGKKTNKFRNTVK